MISHPNSVIGIDIETKSEINYLKQNPKLTLVQLKRRHLLKVVSFYTNESP